VLQRNFQKIILEDLDKKQ